MPVQLVQVKASTLVDQPAWSLDLEKIYAEADPSRRTFDGLSLEAAPFIRLVLQQPECEFAAALFNAHLIAAVWVTLRPQAWQLRHLCVRQVTRRRGVATRLMVLLAQAAQAQGARLTLPIEDLTLADQVLVQRLGYQWHSKDQCFVFDAHV